MSLGTRFEASLAGQDALASAQEFEPMTRVAWGGVPKAHPDSRAYHGWVITPTDAGSHVLTEETQQGGFFLDVIGHQHPGALYRYHQDWVGCLTRAAEAQAIKNAA